MKLTRPLKAALACSAFGTLLSFVCLFKTTPVTMSLFFFFGIPAFAAGIAIHGATFLFGLLKDRD